MVNTIDEIKRYVNPTFGKQLAISSACTGGVFYMGRSYLQINPLHAALFDVVANIVLTVAAILMKVQEQRSVPLKEFVCRSAALLTIAHIPHVLAIVSGVFSSLQVMAIIGANTLYTRLLLTPRMIMPLLPQNVTSN